MQHEIEHILLENYPNPPPPGFPYPPLPQIIHINNNESNKECSIEKYYMTGSNTNLDDIDKLETESVDLNERTAYVISIHEPTEYLVEQEEEYRNVEIEKRHVEISEYEEPQKGIVIIEEINEKLNDTPAFLIENNEVEEKIEREIAQVGPVIEHKFLEYPHLPPTGLYHVSIPKIVSENSIIIIGQNRLEESDNDLPILKKEGDQIKIEKEAEKEEIEEKKVNGTTESNSLDETSTIGEDIKDLRREIETHTSSGQTLSQTIITTQPKNDKDQSIKRFSQKTIQEEEVEQKRIKTTICCCIKC
ncbi:uncharacterized protein LOC129607495 [Condylostylus longicornis]|uniref:uncharacterized protein LOC129607495 n=1 Tax=Condylostylus longicornis TaxID=2530218 RepID=UPI00244E41C4|nr:uncharacterized protein LOC129607495 [Condylostylus longicornis]